MSLAYPGQCCVHVLVYIDFLESPVRDNRRGQGCFDVTPYLRFIFLDKVARCVCCVLKCLVVLSVCLKGKKDLFFFYCLSAWYWVCASSALLFKGQSARELTFGE